MYGPFLMAQSLGIEDDVNNGKFDTALKKSETVLIRFPRFPYSYALKALVLTKLNRLEDARACSIQARDLFLRLDDFYIDDVTLNFMQMVFTQIGCGDWATKCYEHACNKSPSNVNKCIQLFNCYVREGLFDKQQQLALCIYKLSKEEMHLLWAVCSILSQACCANQPKEVLLLSAKACIQKHHRSCPLREPEALMIYIFVLESQSKFLEAFTILKRVSGTTMVLEFDKLRIQGRLLAREGLYEDAAGIYEDALKLRPDDWDCFLYYVGCLFDDASYMYKDADSNLMYPPKSVDCKNLKLTDEEFHSCISRASNFISSLLRHESNIALRGPHRANLEIERMKLEYGKGNIDKLADGLAQYYWRFGGLSCFTSDIESFLPIIDSHGKSGIWDAIKSEYQKRTSLSPTTNNLQQGVALFKIQIHRGKLFTMSIDSLYEIALEMMRTYFRGLSHSKAYDLQGVMDCEDLPSMISNVLVQLFWRTQEIGYLLESIMILEFGLSIRSLIWQNKILLLHLYSFWGCIPMAYERYNDLDVKNILQERVLHDISPKMLVLSPRLSSNLLGGFLRFMDEYLKESGDRTILAYQHKNYSEVVEFMQFKQRLDQSSQYLAAKIEFAILDLKIRTSTVDEVEYACRKLECGGKTFVALSDKFQNTPPTFNEDFDLRRWWALTPGLYENIKETPWTFNEDFDLRPWWTPTPDKNYFLGPFEENDLAKEIVIENTEANVLKAIQRRSRVPRMLYLSLQCASSLAVKEETEELKLLLEQLAGFLSYPFQEAVELVFQVSRGQESLEILSSNMVDWMNFVVFLNAWNLRSQEIEETKTSTWNLVTSLLNMYIQAKVRSMAPLISSPRNDFPELVQLMREPFTWHRLIIQSGARPSYPSGKQEEGGAVGQNAFLRSQEIQDSVRSLYGAFDEVTQWLRKQKNEPKATRSEAILSSLRKNEPQDNPHPGGILSMLGVLISSLKDEEDIGERLFKSLQSWSAAGVAEKLVAGQDTVISEFLVKCEENTEVLKGLMLL